MNDLSLRVGVLL